MRLCPCSSQRAFLPSVDALLSPKQYAHRLPRAGRAHLTTSAQKTSISGSLAESVRQDFPILNQQINGRPLIYFDNAATSQKPLAVLEAMDQYYTITNSNVHRGVHALSVEATTLFENARSKVARFIGADNSQEIVFTRNATEAINLVAYGWALNNLKIGDEILLSVAEHHSNMVPWQIVSKKTGADLKFITLTADTEELNMEYLSESITDRTKLISTFHVSNVLGAISPVAEISKMARKFGTKLLLDCCQSVPHQPIQVKELGADWIVASGHKMCGPTGCGFLWGQYDLLEDMDPFMGGGEMIEDVFLDHFTFADPPAKFEAGTPAIAEAIGLGAACDYLTAIGMDTIHSYEKEIGAYLYRQMNAMDEMKIYGPSPANGRAALCAFNVSGVQSTDLATILDLYGVAIRSGHHCAQPLHRYFGTASSARASLYFYNSKTEIDNFCSALEESIKFFK